MIMMAEHSVDLFEDLLQVFYGRPAADFSETAISETAFSNLASSERFCLSSLNVSGCKKLSADVVLNLSQVTICVLKICVHLCFSCSVL